SYIERIRNPNRTRHKCILELIRHNPDNRVDLSCQCKRLANDSRIGTEGALPQVEADYRVEFLLCLGHVRTKNPPHAGWCTQKCKIVGRNARDCHAFGISASSQRQVVKLERCCLIE